MKQTFIAIFTIGAIIVGLLGYSIYFIKIRKSLVTLPIKTSISQLLQKWAHATGTTGIAVGLIYNGNISYYTFGKKSIDSNELITKETIFEIGSITKVFTTLLLMDMVDEGIIKLDDPIERYISEIKIPEKNGRKITFRHLASHTSGLPRLPTNFIVTNPDNPYAQYSREQLYEFLNSYELPKEPGKNFEYSNLGIGLLGEILSTISNKPFEELVHERISNTLEMPSTGIILTSSMQKSLAQGHHGNTKTSNWDFKTLQGAGALRSTVKDMALFLSANMGLINKALCKTMKACHITQKTFSPQLKASLGWITQKTIKNGNVIIWHNGKTGGYSSFIGFDPDTHRGIVILSNSTNSVDELGLYLIDPINYASPNL